MNQRIKEALVSRNENYILPFLWMKGDAEAAVRLEIRKIRECGITEFCVEARPHPDFCGEGWWHDLAFVLDEAKRNGMKIWILDDARFPTGYANGIITRKYPQHSKQYLKKATFDVCGPMPGASFDTKRLLNIVDFDSPMESMMMSGLLKPELPKDDAVFAVVATKVERSGKLSGALSLNSCIRDGVLYWNVPPGMWKVHVIVLTRNGGGRKGYLNWLDPVSAKLQLEAVYEPHYEHLGEEFGKTILGFFSDEPEIGNTFGYNFNEDIGKEDMPLPYSAVLQERLKKSLGAEWKECLPALWHAFEDESVTAKARYGYMDAVTRLVSENFTQTIGQWCHARGVQYIGHVIEDNNQDCRLGCGMGHYFRALSGQHMSGIDNIGNQVVFGGENGRRNGMTNGDGEFYHYALGKLGSSLGHIDPKKQGRTVCEIFGAYGWGEGTRLMKWLTDHFLVRGVNVFVPHAFSPKEFPDADCPPHFYARGNNPLYRPFGLLMRYMNRMCHVLSGGIHRCSAAILYHAEAKWMGGGMYVQKPARELAENQIDFDFLPADTWSKENPYQAGMKGGVLTVNGEQYNCLVIPQADVLPYDAAVFAVKAVKTGFPVYIVDSLPKKVMDACGKEYEDLCAALQSCTVVPLSGLSARLREDRVYEISISGPFPMLRYYHYETDSHLYFFHNEAVAETFAGEVTLPSGGRPVRYDAFDNRLYELPHTVRDGKTVIKLCLAPYESALVSMESASCPEALPIPTELDKDMTLQGEYQVSYAPVFSDNEVLRDPVNISLLHPEFSGTIRYETSFHMENIPKQAKLVLPEAYEFVEVWLNGHMLGSKIAPPYHFACEGFLKPGDNSLIMEISNTLHHQQGDDINPFSPPAVTEPSGLLAAPILYYHS